MQPKAYPQESSPIIGGGGAGEGVGCRVLGVGNGDSTADVPVSGKTPLYPPLPRGDKGGSSERALLRLRQLACEERAAIQAGDWEALCRISELLGSTIALISPAAARHPDAAAILREARGAQEAAEQFLAARMREVSGLLRQFSTARKATLAYAGANVAPASVLLNDRS
jgi:hypothetical protein